MNETTCSALPATVKELACYLCISSFAQHQERQFKYRTQTGNVFDLPHVKIIANSCILSGKPGSYKSETVRFIKRILDATKIVYNYPHDQVTREFLLSTLVQEQIAKQQTSMPVTIIIDELVNFLNKKEYVEPLIGTLNALLDQPDVYSVGTHKRSTEAIKRPIANIIAACAPSWFKYLPEALFTGGFAGRCMFYEVPYPSDDDRQPRGAVCVPGAEARLAASLLGLPNGHLILSTTSIAMHDQWEMEWGKEDAHPLGVLDEWLKRRAIQTVRLAGAVALSQNSIIIEEEHMLEANKHLEHVKKTLERVWFEVDTDAATAHKMLQIALAGKAISLVDIENLAVRHLRNPAYAQRVISWWLDHSILKPIPTPAGNAGPVLYKYVR